MAEKNIDRLERSHFLKKVFGGRMVRWNIPDATVVSVCE
jgi:hypothetical protein